ncbi:MAG: FAD-linked oxidase C-terminal domain-containing protein [Elusimicrobiota bacterium]
MMGPDMEEHIGSQQMSVLRALKRHFDPNNIMNPGGTLGLDMPETTGAEKETAEIDAPARSEVADVLDILYSSARGSEVEIEAGARLALLTGEVVTVNHGELGIRYQDTTRIMKKLFVTDMMSTEYELPGYIADLPYTERRIKMKELLEGLKRKDMQQPYKMIFMKGAGGEQYYFNMQKGDMALEKTARELYEWLDLSMPGTYIDEDYHLVYLSSSKKDVKYGQEEARKLGKLAALYYLLGHGEFGALQVYSGSSDELFMFDNQALFSDMPILEDYISRILRFRPAHKEDFHKGFTEASKVLDEKRPELESMLEGLIKSGVRIKSIQKGLEELTGNELTGKRTSVIYYRKKLSEEDVSGTVSRFEEIHDIAAGRTILTNEPEIKEAKEPQEKARSPGKTINSLKNLVLLILVPLLTVLPLILSACTGKQYNIRVPSLTENTVINRVITPAEPAYYIVDGKMVEIPGGLDFWKQLLGRDTTTGNFSERISVHNAAQKLLELINDYKLTGVQLKVLAPVVHKLTDYLKESDSTKMPHQESNSATVRYTLGMVSEWNGDYPALAEALPGILEKIYDYRMALLFFDGVSIQEASTVTGLYDYMAALGENRESIKRFQSALYMIKKAAKNELLSQGDADRLLKGLFRISPDADINDIDSNYEDWIERELKPLLAASLDSWYEKALYEGRSADEISPPSGLKSWKEAPWQKVLVRAVAGISFKDTLYVPSAGETERIEYIIDDQRVERKKAGLFLLGLAYADSLRFLPKKTYDRIPVGKYYNLPGAHLTQYNSLFGKIEPWKNAGFAITLGNYNRKFKTSEIPFMSGCILALPAEMGHLHHYLSLVLSGGSWYDIIDMENIKMLENSEIFDRLYYLSVMTALPYLSYPEAVKYVHLTYELGIDALKKDDNGDLFRKIKNIVSEKRWDEISGIIDSNSDKTLEKLIPSEIYYTGLLLREDPLYNSPVKDKLLQISRSIADSGVSRESFSREIDAAAGIFTLVKDFRAEIHELFVPSFWPHGEGGTEEHIAAERITEDIRVWLSGILVEHEIPPQVMPRLVMKIIERIAPGQVQKDSDDWRPVLEEIKRISSKEINNWIEELLEEGVLKRGERPGPGKRKSVKEIYENRDFMGSLAMLVPFIFFGGLKTSRRKEGYGRSAGETDIDFKNIRSQNAADISGVPGIKAYSGSETGESVTADKKAPGLHPKFKELKNKFAGSIIMKTDLSDAAIAIINHLVNNPEDELDMDLAEKILDEHKKVYLTPAEKIEFCSDILGLTGYGEDFWKDPFNRAGAADYVSTRNKKPYSALTEDDFNEAGLNELTGAYDMKDVIELAVNINYEKNIKPVLDYITDSDGRVYTKYEPLCSGWFLKGRRLNIGTDNDSGLEEIKDSRVRTDAFILLADMLRGPYSELIIDLLDNDDMMELITTDPEALRIFTVNGAPFLRRVHPSLRGYFIRDNTFRDSLTSVKKANSFYSIMSREFGMMGNPMTKLLYEMPEVGRRLMNKLDMDRIISAKDQGYLSSIVLFSKELLDSKDMFDGITIAKKNRKLFNALGFTDRHGRIDFDALFKDDREYNMFTTVLSLAARDPELAEFFNVPQIGIISAAKENPQYEEALYRFSKSLPEKSESLQKDGNFIIAGVNFSGSAITEESAGKMKEIVFNFERWMKSATILEMENIGEDLLQMISYLMSDPEARSYLGQLFLNFDAFTMMMNKVDNYYNRDPELVRLLISSPEFVLNAAGLVARHDFIDLLDRISRMTDIRSTEQGEELFVADRRYREAMALFADKDGRVEPLNIISDTRSFTVFRVLATIALNNPVFAGYVSESAVQNAREGESGIDSAYRLIMGESGKDDRSEILNVAGHMLASLENARVKASAYPGSDRLRSRIEEYMSRFYDGGGNMLPGLLYGTGSLVKEFSDFNFYNSLADLMTEAPELAFALMDLEIKGDRMNKETVSRTISFMDWLREDPERSKVFRVFIMPDLAGIYRDTPEVLDVLPEIMGSSEDLWATLNLFTRVPLSSESMVMLVRHIRTMFDPDRNYAGINVFLPALTLFAELGRRGAFSRESADDLVRKLVSGKTPDDYRKWIRNDLADSLRREGRLAGYLNYDRIERKIRRKGFGSWQEMILRAVIGEQGQRTGYHLFKGNMLGKAFSLLEKLGVDSSEREEHFAMAVMSVREQIFHSPKLGRKLYPGFHRRHIFSTNPSLRIPNPWRGSFYLPPQDAFACSPIVYSAEYGHALEARIMKGKINGEIPDRLQFLIARLGDTEILDTAIESQSIVRELAKEVFTGSDHIADGLGILRVFIGRKKRYNAIRDRLVSDNIKERIQGWDELTIGEQYSLGLMVLEDNKITGPAVDELKKKALAARSLAGGKLADKLGAIFVSVLGSHYYRDTYLPGHDMFDQVKDEHIMAEIITQDVAIKLADMAMRLNVSGEVLPFITARFMEWFMESLKQKDMNDWLPAAELIDKVDDKLVRSWLRDGMREGIVAKGIEPGLGFSELWDEYTSRGALDMLKDMVEKEGREMFSRVFGLSHPQAKLLAKLLRIPRRILAMSYKEKDLKFDGPALVKGIFDNENAMRKEVKSIRNENADFLDKFIEKDDSISSITLAEKKHYDAALRQLKLDMPTAKSLLKLSDINPVIAGRVLETVVSMEINRNSEGLLDIEKTVSRVKGIDSARELLSLILWFEIFTIGSYNDKETIARHIRYRLRGFDSKKVDSVVSEVLRNNERFIVEKRDIKPGTSRGVMQADKARKLKEKPKGRIERLVDVIRGLGNVISATPRIPPVLALMAGQGDFDSIAAYALGERRAKPLIVILKEQFDIIAGGRANDYRMYDDLNAFKSMLEAT